MKASFEQALPFPVIAVERHLVYAEGLELLARR